MKLKKKMNFISTTCTSLIESEKDMQKEIQQIKVSSKFQTKQ